MLSIECSDFLDAPSYRVVPEPWQCNFGAIYGPWCYSPLEAIWRWVEGMQDMAKMPRLVPITVEFSIKTAEATRAIEKMIDALKALGYKNIAVETKVKEVTIPPPPKPKGPPDYLF